MRFPHYQQVIHTAWSHTGEVIDILDFKIRKVVHNLDFEIGSAINDFPETRLIRKMVHFFDLQVGKMVYHLYFIVRKTSDELNTSVDS